MTLTLIAAILFTIAALGALLGKTLPYRWVIVALFTLVAAFNWARYFGVVA